MTRLVTVLPLVFVVCVAGIDSPAAAQLAANRPQAVTRIAAAYGELQGIVSDDRGEPLAGAVVSALGSTTAFAISDPAGRFAFRSLPPGPYLVRAHLSGYVPVRGTILQINGASRTTSAITLARRAGPDVPGPIATAGMFGTGSTTGSDEATGGDDHGEVAWRVRHLKRGVLKEVDAGIVDTNEEDESFLVDSLSCLGRAMGTPARMATALFADVPLSGQVNLLTTTSFDRPQDLFSVNAGLPRGVAHVELNAPTPSGEWSARGAMTQGDLASWIVAGSFVRRGPVGHQYEAGLSYSMQRYEGGNTVALRAVSDGSRNAGSMYAVDHWNVAPRVMVSYGANYARYGYMAESDLFSPRVSVVVHPARGTRVRAAASRREIAPGAEEFVPPATFGIWLPPERTFSPLDADRGFQPERTEHYELSAEHDVSGDFVVGVRAFYQQVDNQAVTLFGLELPAAASAEIGHYYVASAGDLETRGWGVSISREVSGRVRGALDYTQTNTEWVRSSPDSALLAMVAGSAFRSDGETLHDVTTSMQTEIPATATRVYVLYKINNGFGGSDSTRHVGTRFDVQVNQSLPFLNFTSTRWEMLVAVRNMFREENLDASPYDELLVMRPPKRIVGGLSVRF
jgi:outer membrane receptor protein involved in Fe transport